MFILLIITTFININFAICPIIQGEFNPDVTAYYHLTDILTTNTKYDFKFPSLFNFNPIEYFTHDLGGFPRPDN